MSSYQQFDFDPAPIYSTEIIRCKDFINECIQEAHSQHRSRVHLLVDEETNFIVGFTALSVGRFDLPLEKIHDPYMIIDQLSVNRLAETGETNLKDIGVVILDIINMLANYLNSKYLGIRHLVIEVDEDPKTIEFYQDYGFKLIPDSWISTGKKTTARRMTGDMIRRKDRLSGKFLQKLYFDLLWRE